MTRILLVEEHPVAATGIKVLIDSDPELKQKVEILPWEPEGKSAPADTSIIFLSLNYKSDVHKYFTTTANAISVSNRFIVFCDESQLAVGLKFLYLGASGLVSQEAEPDEITQCIRKVVNGRTYVCQHSIRKILDVFIANILAGESNPLSFILTSAEHDVIQLLLKGKSMKEIAGDLDVKLSRVSVLKAGAFQKLGVRNLFELTNRVKAVFGR